MATVNRTSLREAFDEQKRTFERLKHEGRMTPETIALVNALLMLMEMLVAVFLEKTTSKTGLNSGSAQFPVCAGRDGAQHIRRQGQGPEGKGGGVRQHAHRHRLRTERGGAMPQMRRGSHRHRQLRP